MDRAIGMLKHPLAKGMLAYTILWPTGCLIQQTMSGKRWGKLKVMIQIGIFILKKTQVQ